MGSTKRKTGCSQPRKDERKSVLIVCVCVCVLDVNLALVPERDEWGEFQEHISQLKHPTHPEFVKERFGTVI